MNITVLCWLSPLGCLFGRLKIQCGENINIKGRAGDNYNDAKKVFAGKFSMNRHNQ